VEDRSARGPDAAGLTGGAPLLLYDGACGFCAESVRLVLRHERRHTLRFAALQSPVGETVRARHPEIAGIDSMIWVEPAADGRAERVYVRSDAALRIAGYLGGAWSALAPARLLPRFVRDRTYDFIARHRHRISGSLDACLVPPPATRERFLG
jgi:predicted DCC family thiol-disulfide oxidoreductase YuxK